MNFLVLEERKQLVVMAGDQEIQENHMVVEVVARELKEIATLQMVEVAIKVLFVYGIIEPSTSPSMRTCRSGM